MRKVWGGGGGGRECLVLMVPEPPDPFSTPSPPFTAAFACRWCRACGPLLLEWVGRGTVPWSLPFVFPKTSCHNWQLKNMMVNSQSSCWPWEVWEAPCSWAMLLYQGTAAYPHFYTSSCCPGAEVSRRRNILLVTAPQNRRELCTKMDFGSMIGSISHCSQ